MKLLSYRSEEAGQVRVGVLVDRENRVLDLGAACRILGAGDAALFASMQDLIDSGTQGLDAAAACLARLPQEATLGLAEVQLLAPLPCPVQMRDFLCFELHLQQSFAAGRRVAAAQAPDPVAAMADMERTGKFAVPEVWYRQPIYYKCNRFAVCGPGTEVVWPRYSKLMDYELELAAVIGRGGRDIPRERALEHVFGYTIFNDFSARDAQMIEGQGMLGPAKGKDFDNANVLGPWLVTADEIGDPYSLEMVVRVNGQERGRGNSASMYWKFEDAIAHVSRDETLYPGEVIGSGTVGNGCGLESLQFLADGDEVELEIDRIGCLRNRVRVRHD
jgi:2-keto-4-pentenoate hydratase/2-oxohepta-3-ene-1,7-dioic acid hydratase in catechol pathway